MSRVGKLPIPIPDGVEVTTGDGVVAVTGPKGSLTQHVPTEVSLEESTGGDGARNVLVRRPSDQPRHRAMHGLVRALVANMVHGVTQGYEKRLEIVGVGYRFVQAGADVDLSAGFSHPVKLSPPAGIEYNVIAPNQLAVAGIDKQLVGHAAAEIRKLRPPEPYKGKGIKYQGEHIRRKIGKRAQ